LLLHRLTWICQYLNLLNANPHDVAQPTGKPEVPISEVSGEEHPVFFAPGNLTILPLSLLKRVADR
jgi:hypothetical protein